MGQVGNKFLQLTNSKELNAKLLGIYAFEKENHQILEGVSHRFAGMNELLFKDTVVHMKEEMKGFYKVIQERLAMRDIDIPMTLIEVGELNPCKIDADFDTNDRDELIGHVLELYRMGIELYGNVVEMIKGKDIVLLHELLPIFKYYVDMECEVENFIQGNC